MAILDQAWANSRTSIVQIVAPGGVGKTQLVKKWQERLLDRDDQESPESRVQSPERAFDWSFYSQGTQQQAAADDFFDRALRWFGESEPKNYKDPWAKGERLGELVKQQRTLLILDGLEPLQHPPGPMAGELTDPSIQALLQALQRDNPGLCILTTREAVPVLNEMSQPKRLTVDLSNLSPAAGAELLKRYDVTGEPDELRQASVDVEGHALALILLGTYLKVRCDGEVSRRSDALLFQGHERYAAHAHKVMASYEAWFEKEDDIGRAAIAILRLMGLFNRPADAGCLAALRVEPPIPGLTDALFSGDRDEVWKRAIERLRSARLLADGSSALESWPSTLDSLDCHPLVREHFAVQLDEQFPEGAREAHRRLYEHLKRCVPEFPDNLGDMMPLHHAVSHGCKAGLTTETFEQIFLRRIMRGSVGFGTKHLGAVVAGLAALSNFYDQCWDVPSKWLSGRSLGSLLSFTAFHLSATGRQLESVAPMREGLATHVVIKQWDTCATDCNNLCEASVTLGDVASAVRFGEQSVEFGDRSQDLVIGVIARTALGDALHFAGKYQDALSAFQDAWRRQKDAQPENPPILYSVQAYRYCDLLLSNFAIQIDTVAESPLPSTRTGGLTLKDVEVLATNILNAFATGSSMLDNALTHLTLGRTCLLKAMTEVEASDESQRTELMSSLQSAERHLGISMKLLRSAGQPPQIPRGLLHRASLWRVCCKACLTSEDSQVEEMIKYNATLAEQDLWEVETIAKRGTMLVWQIDAALERARLAMTLHESQQAQQKLDEARELIRQTEKPYEPHVPDWSDWEPPEYVGVFNEGEIVGYHRRNDELSALQKAIDEASRD